MESPRHHEDRLREFHIAVRVAASWSSVAPLCLGVVAALWFGFWLVWT